MKKVDLSGLDPDLESDGEKMHRFARIGISAVPVVGGPLVEIFNSVLEAPLSKRRAGTMIQIGEVINELIERKVVTEEGLQENDAFISTVAEVCAISLRNHESEKLEALRNAVKNSALPSCPSDDYRQLFLNFVDVCTVTHIRLLHLFADPEAWVAREGKQFPSSWSMGGIDQVIEFALPELEGREKIYKVIWKDLYQRGLINTDNLGMTMSAHGMKESRTTEMGSALIKFLS
ncbi:hypothetical protein [Pseudomonas lini]|uniref:hypothetical protein n=1 Tax=Pseudomonas lini TaxID=163011 RepID=UPI0006818A77|nr:hypothetical protein [Pseudomonas lini]KNH48326.1 hypothetical protein ACS73_00190 [Pseudomonas lini]